MARRNPRIGLALVSMLVLSAVAACGQKHEDKSAKQTQTNASAINNYDRTSVYVVELSNINDEKPLGAIYTADDLVQARARIGGTLVRLNVTEGSQVGQGQIIGIIDEARMGAEIAAGAANASAAQSAANAAAASARQAPAQMAAAQAIAQKAQADYNRTKILFDQGVYAQAKLDQMRSAMMAANAQIAVANAGIGAANANVDASRAQAQSAAASANIARAVRAQGQILAPRAGRVVMVPTTQGAVIMPGEIIASIAVGTPVLRLMIPEADARFISIGQKLRVAGQSGAIDNFAAIVKIYPMVENGQIKIDLAPETPMQFIGSRVEVLVPTGKRDAIFVPENYIITRQGVDFIALLSGNEALEIPIKRGIAQNGKVEILTGLKIGDKIIAPKAINNRPIAPAKQ